MAERENMRCDFDLIIDEICRRLKAENSLREAEQKSTFSEAEILRLKKELGEVKGRNIDLHNEYVLLKTHYESLARKYDTLNILYDDKCGECQRYKDKLDRAEKWIKGMKNKDGENNAKYVYCAVDEKDEIKND